MTPPFVHESAYVDEGAVIGEGSKVWHFCHVMPGAVIGRDCSLGQNVVVMGGTRIGDNVKIQNNVSIYEGVELEDDVFCGPSMVFTNVVNPRSHVPRKHEYRKTLVKRGASIGANATIVCGVTIGAYALIGAGSVVTRDVPPHAMVRGNPAQVYEKGLNQRVVVIEFDSIAKATAANIDSKKNLVASSMPEYDSDATPPPLPTSRNHPVAPAMPLPSPNAMAYPTAQNTTSEIGRAHV